MLHLDKSPSLQLKESVPLLIMEIFFYVTHNMHVPYLYGIPKSGCYVVIIVIQLGRNLHMFKINRTINTLWEALLN